jgi:4-alpha-glucanotransferase
VNDPALRQRAEQAGILTRYRDTRGRVVDANPDSLRLVLARLEPVTTRSVIVARPGAPITPATRRGSLVTEDNQEIALPETLPGPVGYGYHQLVSDGDTTPLLVAPDRCFLPAARTDNDRYWGYALQLHAARSTRSWGFGDLADLASLATSETRPDFVLVSPLHAATPGVPQQPSPYYPSSRVFRNPLYIAVDRVEEFTRIDPALRAWAVAAGRGLNTTERISRDASYLIKHRVLGACYERASPARRASVERYTAATALLGQYAVFCAISERHGSAWQRWPAPLRDAQVDAVREYAAANADRVGYHAYLQLLVDQQLAALPALPFGYLLDLAVGADAAGFDAWTNQDTTALGFSIGAPPDPLGPRGQDWGVAPTLPAALATDPSWYRMLVRGLMRHAAGIRIDHVMGLFRLFWIPNGASPGDGVYVRYPSDVLLAIIAIESRRAGCLVIGEDLGTVEPNVRTAMGDQRILSYRLAIFEDSPPDAYPPLAMAAATTHDLPPLRRFFAGGDARYRHAIGAIGDDQLPVVTAEDDALRRRLVNRLDTAPPQPGDAAASGALVEATYRMLAETPSMLVAVSLADAFGQDERDNVPGTTNEHPNWSVALPAPLDRIDHLPLARRVADAARRDQPA